MKERFGVFIAICLTTLLLGEIFAEAALIRTTVNSRDSVSSQYSRVGQPVSVNADSDEADGACFCSHHSSCRLGGHDCLSHCANVLLIGHSIDLIAFQFQQELKLFALQIPEFPLIEGFRRPPKV